MLTWKREGNSDSKNGETLWVLIYCSAGNANVPARLSVFANRFSSCTITVPVPEQEDEGLSLTTGRFHVSHVSP